MNTTITFADFFQNLDVKERILLCGLYEASKQPREIVGGPQIAELSMEFIMNTSIDGKAGTAKAEEFFCDMQVICSDLQVEFVDDEYYTLLGLYQKLMEMSLFKVLA